jgi:cyanate permease
MLLGGYVLSSIGPVGLGVLRDATGAYSISLWLLVGLAAILVGSCLALSPARLRRGVGRQPVGEA